MLKWKENRVDDENSRMLHVYFIFAFIGILLPSFVYDLASILLPLGGMVYFGYNLLFHYMRYLTEEEQDAVERNKKKRPY